MLNPFTVVGQAKSYISTGTGLLNNPRHLLGKTALSFLSDTTLERMRGRSDPAMSCFWDIVLPDIENSSDQKDFVTEAGNTLQSWSSKASSIGLDGVGSLLSSAASTAGSVGSWLNNKLAPTAFVKLDSEYVEAATLPFREYSARNVFRASGERKFPSGTATLGDLNLTFYVGDDNEAFRYITNWMNLVMLPSTATVYTGAWSLPSLYKKTITLILMDVNSNEIYKVDYIGSWPTSFSDVELDAGGDRLTYNVSFSVDDINIYGFDYVSLSDQLSNIGSGLLSAGKTALSNAASSAMKSFSAK